jgi:hypothetical protein
MILTLPNSGPPWLVTQEWILSRSCPAASVPEANVATTIAAAATHNPDRQDRPLHVFLDDEGLRPSLNATVFLLRCEAAERSHPPRTVKGRWKQETACRRSHPSWGCGNVVSRAAMPKRPLSLLVWSYQDVIPANEEEAFAQCAGIQLAPYVSVGRPTGQIPETNSPEYE